MSRRIALALGIAALAATTALGAPLAFERVSFDSLDRDADGKPVRLTALRYAPQGDPTPRGAVIALHGCGGIYRDGKQDEDVPTARHSAMAEMLVREGYVVLFPDSFNPRGVRDICKIKIGERSVKVQQRRLDILASLAWLRSEPGIAADRIALLGWSHGGSTTLATINARNKDVATFRRDSRAPFFATAIAFYPGCGPYVSKPGDFAPATPLAIFMGESDDWTPVEPCVKLAKAMESSQPPVAITTYPGAYHGFDGPATRKQVLRDVPNGVNPGAGVTIAGDPAARRDAYAKVTAILRAAIGPHDAVRAKDEN